MTTPGQIPTEDYLKGKERKTGRRVGTARSSPQETIILEYVPYYHQRQRLD